jgi:mRNA interferase MazF
VNILPGRGELWWCELPDVGRRPVVVLSRDAAIPRLRRVLVARLGRLADSRMREICAALGVAVDCRDD